MLNALTQLLLFQLTGEILARSLKLPVPGPVLGMLFLFLWLSWRGRVATDLQHTSQGLLQHLSLLFVPAGTGIMVHLSRLSQEWLPLLLALVISTFAGLAVTALVMQALMQGQAAAEDTAHDTPGGAA